MGREVIKVTILNGTSVSEKTAAGAGRIVGVVMPAAWTAADLSFEGYLLDGVTPGPAIDKAGTQIKITAPAAGAIVVLSEGTDLWMIGPYRLRSGTTAAAVNQGADRVLGVVIETS